MMSGVQDDPFKKNTSHIGLNSHQDFALIPNMAINTDRPLMSPFKGGVTIGLVGWLVWA